MRSGLLVVDNVFQLAIFWWICSTVLPASPYGYRMVVRSQTDPQSECLPAAAVTGPHKSLLSPTGGTRCFCPSHNEGPPPWWLLTVCKQRGSWRLIHMYTYTTHKHNTRTLLWLTRITSHSLIKHTHSKINANFLFLYTSPLLLVPSHCGGKLTFEYAPSYPPTHLCLHSHCKLDAVVFINILITSLT